MSFRKQLLSKLLSVLLTVLLVPQLCFAQLVCSDIYRHLTKQTIAEFALDPHVQLRELLEINGESYREWRTARKLENLKFNKNMSEGQIRKLVKALFKMRYGDYIKYKDLLKDSDARFDARMTRLLQEEVAAVGLIRFFKSRGMFKEKDSLLMRFRSLKESNLLAAIASAGSFLSLQTPTPVVMLPNFKLFSMNRGNLEMMILYGRKSDIGRKIEARHISQESRDFYATLFTRTFNRIAWGVALAMLMDTIGEDQDQVAFENGREFIESINKAVGNIERIILNRPNRDDIAYDVMLKNFESVLGRQPTDEDLHELCVRLPAARRCS